MGGRFPVSRYVDTPRGRLAHKLRDGAYRAKQYGCYVDPELTIETAAHLLDMFVCYYCFEPLRDTEPYSLEHKIPLKKGGHHALHNICLACYQCNLDKSTMTYEEFMDYLDTL